MGDIEYCDIFKGNDEKVVDCVAFLRDNPDAVGLLDIIFEFINNYPSYKTCLTDNYDKQSLSDFILNNNQTLYDFYLDVNYTAGTAFEACSFTDIELHYQDLYHLLPSGIQNCTDIWMPNMHEWCSLDRTVEYNFYTSVGAALAIFLAYSVVVIKIMVLWKRGRELVSSLRNILLMSVLYITFAISYALAAISWSKYVSYKNNYLSIKLL